MQADLFNLSISNSFERQAFQKSFFEKKYTLRLDQMLALGLIAIVFFVVIFAWGSEHGKAVSHRDIMMQSQARSASEIKSATVHPQPAVEVQSEPVAVAPTIEMAAEGRSEVSSPAASSVLNQVETKSVAARPALAKYTIAHMTYVKKDQALREISRIKSKGYAPFLVSSGRFFQICVNGFENRKSSNDAIKSLKAKGLVSPDAYVRNMPATAA